MSKNKLSKKEAISRLVELNEETIAAGFVLAEENDNLRNDVNVLEEALHELVQETDRVLEMNSRLLELVEAKDEQLHNIKAVIENA